MKLTDKHKAAYKQYWMVKGHLDISPQSALESYDGYFTRLWRAGSDGAPLHEYEKGFEEAWQQLLKKCK